MATKKVRTNRKQQQSRVISKPNCNGLLLRQTIPSSPLVRYHLPFIEGDDPLLHAVHHRRVVRGHDDGLAGFVELRQDLHDLGGILGIEVSGRLIADNDVWIVNECPGDRHALHLSPRELVDELVCLGEESYLRQYLRHARRDMQVIVP